MANALLTISKITREAIRLFRNTNSFIQAIDQQYDDQFAVAGAKIGTQLRIRLPVDYVVRTGPAAQIQDTAEQQTVLTLATQKGVDMEFTSTDLTMSLDDFSRRILAPAINNLVGAVALDVMTGSEGGVANLQANLDGSGNLLSPIASTVLTAAAVLDTNSARTDERMIVNDPFTDARIVATLSGLFNPTPEISRQYRSGAMKQALGFGFMRDQTAIKHTTGSYTAGTVNGAGQTGLTLTTNAITGTLALGDIITIANVNAVNRVTKQTTGQLRQFVVTAPAANGATSISIYPAIVPPVAGNAVQYQTVDSSPANSAAISLVIKPNVTYRKNIGFVPEAVTMATADLFLPRGVEEAAREQFDGVAMRMISQYDIRTDERITRLDMLYGYLYARPEWAVIIPDII
jgi:hypothetical protein